MSTLEQRTQQVLDRIAKAAARAGRSPDAITLVAVSKTWPVETVLDAYAVGLRHFGENRVEEMAAKQTAVAAALGDEAAQSIVWHAIGALQSRKTNTVADQATVFHALDRIKIANRLSRQLTANGRFLPVFLEVNVSGEGSKSGFAAADWENDATQQQQLRKVVEHVTALPGLQLQGLMTMAPWGAPEATIRAVFCRTRQLAEWLQSDFPDADLSQLSMGMTDDFELAIEEGATHVRVGRAIFSERK